MYETLFNLSQRPFGCVPQVDQYYPAASIEAARTTLARCLQRAEGVGLLVGPAGTGKTLLCQLLAEQFKGEFQVALLGSGRIATRRALLQAILYELGQPYRGMDEGDLRLSLAEHLTLDDRCPRGAVLLVDEAHALPLRLLDEIRVLTNLAHEGQPRVRLLVAGNRMLEEHLASPKLESFNQRVVARCYLEALNRTETQEYIYSRIAAVGGQGPQIFPAEACQSVYKATDGVPRLVNQVCDHALLLAYAAGQRTLEPARVEEAWADLQQLPTPWNEQPQPSDNIIEFGGLEDDASETASSDADQPAAETESPPSESSLHLAPEPADTNEDTSETEAADLEASEQLRQIQEMLADVRARVLSRRLDRARGRTGVRRRGASVPRGVCARGSHQGPLRDGDGSDRLGRRARRRLSLAGSAAYVLSGRDGRRGNRSMVRRGNARCRQASRRN